MSKSFLGRLMLDLDGNSLTQEENKILLNPHVGGVILFARNISSRDQVQELCGAIRNINPNSPSRQLILFHKSSPADNKYKFTLVNFESSE